LDFLYKIFAPVSIFEAYIYLHTDSRFCKIIKKRLYIMNIKKYIYGFMVLVMFATLATAVPVLAATPSYTGRGGMMNRGNIKPGVFGTVSSVNGNILTVASKQRSKPVSGATTAPTTSPITYTVDATNAKITKNNVAGTISSIVVGDTIIAQGTLTGTNLVATTIRDGAMARGVGVGENKINNPGGQNGAGTPAIVGNGQPVVAGTVSTVSGSTITITNKSNATYTVDATNAKIVQGANTISISGIAVGDMVVVQGAVNGNSITASSVIDQKPVVATAVGTTAQPSRGFFGSIGHFFSSLFGF
jgi:hypothetical protein